MRWRHLRVPRMHVNVDVSRGHAGWDGVGRADRGVKYNRAAEAATQLDAGVKASACSRSRSSHQRQRIKHVCPLHDSARRLLGRSTINTHTTCVSLRCAQNTRKRPIFPVRCSCVQFHPCEGYGLPNSTHFGVSGASDESYNCRRHIDARGCDSSALSVGTLNRQ